MLGKCVAWMKECLNSLTEVLVAFLVTVLGYTLTLYFFNMLWSLYRETQVGEHFQAANPDMFFAISSIMDRNFFLFSLVTCFMVIKICFVIAVICHVLPIKRLFYDSRGIVGRIVCWGVPCAGVVAAMLPGPFVRVSFAFCLLPTLALFSYCFGFVSKVIPGLDFSRILRLHS
ncbi:MAG: hypothetical protein GY868_02260 [Deltaproteobacteria bacterium]|nr:hypothetical protein [Deltaproteobacteria bacterium]